MSDHAAGDLSPAGRQALGRAYGRLLALVARNRAQQAAEGGAPTDEPATLNAASEGWSPSLAVSEPPLPQERIQDG